MLHLVSRLPSVLRRNKSGTRPAVASKRSKSIRLGLEELETRLVPSSVPLHVAGNLLKDSANNTVVLRGVNIASLEWRPDGYNVMQAVNIYINDWHANLLRLPVNEDYWFGHDQQWSGGESGDGGAAYRDLVDQVISAARANNVYVMLDLHWSNMGVWGATNGQHFLPDDYSTLFWQNAAARYANDPAVLFDPYNEPHFANDLPTDAEFAEWRDGGWVNETGEFFGNYHSPGMQGLINTIRSTGANNIIAPEGLNWGANLAGVLNGHALADPAGNLMYQSHLYQIKIEDPEVASSVETLGKSFPIYVGEWGEGGVIGQPDANAAAYNQQRLAYLDNHPNFSWTAWAMPVLDHQEYNLLTAWDGNATTSDYGAYVKTNLAAHANAPAPAPPAPPAPPAANDGFIVVAAGAGTEPLVRVLDAQTRQERFHFLAYSSAFQGGVHVAVGDVNGDGIPDIITAPAAGWGPRVKVFSGADGTLLASFLAYSSSFTGGVFVAAGDVNGDGKADIITGPGAGLRPRVKVFDGATLDPYHPLASFLAYPSSFLGGVHVAAGDTNGDGRAEIITGPGAGWAPRVKVFGASNPGSPLASFLAYRSSFTGGVFVAAGDVNGDGKADIITGPGAGLVSRVKVFNGAQPDPYQPLASFLAYDTSFRGGVPVAARDINGDGKADIIMGAGPGSPLKLWIVDLATWEVIDSFYATGDPLFSGGAFVGA